MAVDKGKIFSNRNIIILMIILFVGWLMFFDQNSYLDLKGLDAKIIELEEERDFYKKKIAEDSLVIKHINDPAFLQRYARENYFYVQEGEILYIIEDTTKSNSKYR